jgi:hypothetical protein
VGLLPCAEGNSNKPQLSTNEHLGQVHGLRHKIKSNLIISAATHFVRIHTFISIRRHGKATCLCTHVPPMMVIQRSVHTVGRPKKGHAEDCTDTTSPMVI